MPMHVSNLAVSLPVDDWQFWVATVIALGAAYFVARMILPKAWFPGGKKAPSRKVTLTIDGRPPERK